MWGVAALRERGWTPAMVSRLLGAPDKTVPNSHYKAGAPMRLWAAERVVEIERTPEWVAAQQAAAKRSQASLRVAQTKRDELLTQVQAMPVQVARLDPERLLRAAIDHYNRNCGRRYWDEGWQAACANSDALFLERIQVNFLRHQGTHYDRALEAVAGRIGVGDAVEAIRRKVYAAIAEAYPALADECGRQLARREDPFLG